MLLGWLVWGVGGAVAQCGEWTEPVGLVRPVALEASECPTWRAEDALGLAVDWEAWAAVRAGEPGVWHLRMPAPHHPKLTLTLERFDAFAPDLVLGTTEGPRFEARPYQPALQAYRVVGGSAGPRIMGAPGTGETGGNPEIGGVIILLQDGLVGTVVVGGHTYELGRSDRGTYRIFDVNAARERPEFQCGMEDLAYNQRHRLPRPSAVEAARNLPPKCVEIALDIDHYTYNTLGANCGNSVEWALAMLSGVHAIYTAQLSGLVSLEASYVHVWQSPDPYAAFTQNAGQMLNSLRSEWVVNPNLAPVPRDLVHLLTRRTNTGTGGIAYLDVVCGGQYATGFSSYLSATTTYPLGGYSWNLNVVAHELGHNFGANHTHWCGWPGGPIDNCGNLEGPCGGYVNNPTPQTGTIMSYCHAIAGGSVNLVFHPTVKSAALIPTINSDGYCLTECNTFATNCENYGCTQPGFCNYDPEAELDDGSCTTFDACGECGGDGTSCVGCTAPLACNYDPAATQDDGSCFFAPGGGGCDCQAQLSLTAELTGGQTAQIAVPGLGNLGALTISLVFTNLTGSSAVEARDLAVTLVAPDGSCVTAGGFDVNFGCPSSGFWPGSWASANSGTYQAQVSLGALAGAGTWYVRIGNGWSQSPVVRYDVMISLFNLCIGDAQPGCTDDAACNYDPTAPVDNGSCEYTSCLGCTDTGACNYDPTALLPDGTCEYTSCAGCTDPGACNFNFEALLDDGSCEFTSCVGCTDFYACNFDAAATIGDVSLCEYTTCAGCMDPVACNFDPDARISAPTSCDYVTCLPCPGDLNTDGSVSVADVLVFLSDFGCTTPPCPGDATENGTTDVADLLAVLAAFGGVCWP